MAHFAKLDDDNNVIGVHVVNNEVLLVNGQESEEAGVAFLSELYGYAKWKQTSYNRSFRKNYAFPGCKYDVIKDCFILPKPFSSYILNEELGVWDPPIPCPEDGKRYKWSEEDLNWIEQVQL